ncbi:MAG: VCBS repeat-containing protein, partial [Planctomycetales bacterium]|nr:VCBS repeat-containing protein [Planctomycetales bacterium]
EDLFISQPAGLPCRLLIQQEDGTLQDQTREYDLEWLDASRNGMFVDLDNDGDQDFIISLNYSTVIFENLAPGKLFLRTQIDVHSWPASFAAADYDGDGDVDLFICGYNPRGETAPGDIFANPVPYHDANNGARNFMMQNDGEFAFSDVTAAVGFDANNHRFSFAATWEDYDNDGDPDLYVANDFGRNNLYRNDRDANGQVRFTDVAREAGVEDISAGMSVSWGDYNHDGLMDVYVSNMFSSAGNRITYQEQFKTNEDDTTRASIQRHARGNTLFQNNGDGTFRDVSVDAHVTMGRWAWGSLFTDINNDSWEDIYVTNGFFTTPDTGDL